MVKIGSYIRVLSFIELIEALIMYINCALLGFYLYQSSINIMDLIVYN